MVKVLKYLVCSQHLKVYSIFICGVYLTNIDTINNNNNKIILPLINRYVHIAIHIHNDRELACLERVETSSKPPKTCILAMPNLPLSSPDTHSEDQSEHHRNTIFINFTIY